MFAKHYFYKKSSFSSYGRAEKVIHRVPVKKYKISVNYYKINKNNY